MLQRNKFARRLRAAARLFTHMIDPADHLVVELQVYAHGVVKLATTFNQASQDFIDIIDGKSIVRAIVANRPLLSGTPAIPDLTSWIPLPAKQDVLPLSPPRNQHQHGLRLGKSGQIEKITIWAIRVKRI